MKFLALSGSTRRASTNTALLSYLRRIAPTGVEISVYNGIQRLPVFSQDLEGTHTPPAVTELIELINDSDGLIVSSPEYVHAIPGGLKNAIDWLVSREEVMHMPVVLVHASHRGDDMLESLRLVLSTITDQFYADLFLRLPLVALSEEQIVEKLTNPDIQLQLCDFLQQLIDRIKCERMLVMSKK